MRQWALIHFFQFVSPHSDSFQKVFASPEPSKSTEQPLKKQQIHQTNVKKTKFEHFWTLGAGHGRGDKSCPVQSGLFSAEGLHPGSNQPALSFPASLPPGTVLTYFWSTNGNRCFWGGRAASRPRAPVDGNHCRWILETVVLLSRPVMSHAAAGRVLPEVAPVVSDGVLSC